MKTRRYLVEVIKVVKGRSKTMFAAINGQAVLSHADAVRVFNREDRKALKAKRNATLITLLPYKR
jgi:hypothetical protein